MAEITPTRRLVTELLCQEERPLTPSRIASSIDRSARSVRTALRELEDAGRVTWRTDVNDARRRLYALTDQPTPTSEPGPEQLGDPGPGKQDCAPSHTRWPP